MSSDSKIVEVEEQIINPFTGRQIKYGNKIYKQLAKLRILVFGAVTFDLEHLGRMREQYFTLIGQGVKDPLARMIEISERPT